MLKKITENLARQDKALEVLDGLLQEEFSLLMDRNPQEVTALEFSIHELLRQVAAERMTLRNELNEKPLLQVAESLPESMAEVARTMRELAASVDEREQRCARQASCNAELVLALMDQGQEMLEFLHNKIVPEKKDAYSKAGRYAKPGNTQARLVNGRL